jgi:hypothetical protein
LLFGAGAERSRINNAEACAQFAAKPTEYTKYLKTILTKLEILKNLV